jgi:hypothetical protein
VSCYLSILPWVSSLSSEGTEISQFKVWTEHLLVRLCILSDQSAETGEFVESAEALHAYRFWAKYWETNVKNTGAEGSTAARYRRLAWKSYYDTLSTILRHDLPYHVESSFLGGSEKNSYQRNSDTRLQQRAELKRVETVYEALLLKETQFPKASDSNQEMEAWTDSIMHNWRFLCGSTWSDQDLGEGGKEAVGRGVLDVSFVLALIYQSASLDLIQ